MRQIHDFSGILAAHVRALIEAEAESAATTAEFIQQVVLNRTVKSEPASGADDEFSVAKAQ